jgi:septum formation inhibitor-activating ATPase MinD
MDADDELLEIAEFIKNNTQHNNEIKPKRVKYLYTTKAKKIGGKFAIGDLVLRSELDKLVNDEFDYILVVYYHI